MLASWLVAVCLLHAGPDHAVHPLQDHTRHTLKNTLALKINAGDTVFLLTEIKLSATPVQPQVRLIAVRADRGVSTAPWAELIAVKRRIATVRYPVRVRSAADQPKDIRFVIDVRDGQSGKSVGNQRVQHTVVIGPIRADAEDLLLDTKAYLHHQRLAQQAYDKLPELKDYLRLDRVDRPPSPSRVPEAKNAILQSFLQHRFHADIARQRLRTAADHEDQTIALAAALALGKLSAKPSGPAARARAIEGVSRRQALKLATSALDDLQIDEAEGILNKLRLGGTLNKRALAMTLALQGAVSFLRNKPQVAIRNYGAAHCLVSGLRPQVSRNILRKRFEQSVSAPGCAKAISFEQVRATRKSVNGELVVQVHLRISPDPHQVVSGGKVQLWGSGGQIAREATARVQTKDGVAYLLVDFPEDEESLSGAWLLMKAEAQHVSGVTLATLGDDKPQAVQIEDGGLGTALIVPTWLWVVTGSAALVGGAVAGVWALSQSNQINRAIGPVDIRF